MARAVVTLFSKWDITESPSLSVSGWFVCAYLGTVEGWEAIDRHSPTTPYRRPIMPPAGRKDSWRGAARTSPQGRTIPILSMQIITGCLSIVAR